MSEEQPDPEHVRDFLRGFLSRRGPTDPLGQALASGLLEPLIKLPDDAVAVLIERGREARREG